MAPEKLEWVDGYLFDPPHNHLERRRLLAILLANVRARDLGQVLRSYADETGARAGAGSVVLSREHLERLKETYLDGPADLVVEIVSPESGKKFYEYESGGVQEYWLIDPQAHRAEFYRLERGAYRLAFSGDEGVYRSAVLSGFWLRVEWLWQETLPKTLSVLRELEVI